MKRTRCDVLPLQDGTNEQQDITDEFTEVSSEERQAVDS